MNVKEYRCKRCGKKAYTTIFYSKYESVCLKCYKKLSGKDLREQFLSG